jgi:hypothetical protein
MKTIFCTKRSIRGIVRLQWSGYWQRRCLAGKEVPASPCLAKVEVPEPAV